MDGVSSSIPHNVVVEDSLSQNQLNSLQDEENDNEGEDIQSSNQAYMSNNPTVGSTEDTVENETSTLIYGMLFDSLDSLFDAYQEYARRKGFSIVKRASKKKNEADYKYSLMVCDKAGKSKAQKTSKKVDCKARLNAKKLDNGSWMVTKIVTEHNHEIDPTFAPLMPAHRRLSVHMKRQLEANDIAGIRTCKNVRLLEVQCGGPQNMGCLPKDCRNFIEERRRLRLGDGDAEAIRKMFVRLQLKDRNFFYLMDIDAEGRLCNVLWIHPRSRAAYQEFHDVISFDTTYLVNRYKMPFASIVGVNHHGHSILLGCALVTHEDATSFKWLFSNWLEAMDNIHPLAIITDQCQSIKIAIRDLMPDTIHRYCIWHIFSKLQQKFRGVEDFNRCTVEFKGIVYDSLTTDTFETKWGEFLEKYGMQNNEWLSSLFNERDKWVPVYLHDTFWAGMISTQRSEGMHAYFDEFVHSRSTLKQFMEQYDMAITNKIEKEYIADFQSKNKIVKCATRFVWEKQFQRVYTNSIFKLVQAEIERMYYCHIVPRTEEELAQDLNEPEIEKFNVFERCLLNDFFVKEFTYTVEWRADGEYINCNCKKFEFKGILCCHIMQVLSLKNIESVNERYLLRRWRKDVHRPHTSIVFAGGYPHMTDEYKKFQEVEKYFQLCTDVAMGNSQALDIIKQRCIQMREEILSSDHTTNENHHEATTQSVEVEGTPVLDPLVTNPVGRPREYVRGRGRRGGGRGTRGRGTRGRGTRGRGTRRAAVQDNSEDSFVF